ncbi:MAG: hypothetical protein AAF235_10615 [Planctomycetota bacterium]
MTNAEFTKQLKKLVTKLERSFPAPAEGEADPSLVPAAPEEADGGVHDVIYAYLLWESTADKAQAAFKRCLAAFSDCNEMRVAMPSELVELFGAKYPRAEERADRLRLTLNAIFHTEHVLSLDRVTEVPKREAKAYLDGLDAIPSFVASRVALLRFGAHAVPVDERLRALLISESVLDAGDSDDMSAVCTKLERGIRAGEAEPFYLGLERFAASSPAVKRKKPVAEKRPRRSSAAGASRAGSSKKTTSKRS